MSSQTITSPEKLCDELMQCFDIVMCSERGYAVVSPRPGWQTCFRRLNERLVSLYGLQAKLVGAAEGLVVIFIRVKRTWGMLRVVLLALATLFAVSLAGFEVARAYAEAAARLGARVNVFGLMFAFVAGLLGPLAIHEGGHYTAARRRGVPVSPPLFIPAPPPKLGGIGTFGAIILMRGMPYDRDSLALLGIAGPLLGFLAGVVVAALGLAWSLVVPPHLVSVGGGGEPVPFVPLILLLIGSIVVKGSGVVLLHPLAFAAYIVFLVTFLNLLPIGWLDGGHVVYAVFGERVHRATSMLTPWAAILAALLYPQLLFIGVFSLLAYGLYLFTARGVHPGVLNPFERLGGGRAAAYALLYTLLLMLTMPVPA